MLFWESRKSFKGKERVTADISLLSDWKKVARKLYLARFCSRNRAMTSEVKSGIQGGNWKHKNYLRSGQIWV